MIQITETSLKDVLLITPDVFEDFRGEYIEIYNEVLYTKEINRITGSYVKFIQDDISVSSQNVLRGIHGDTYTWKLISCIQGRIYLVVVDCDKSSPQFGRWQAFTLSDTNRQQVLVPPFYGNGHLVLSKQAIFHYKQSAEYSLADQFTYRYDTPRFGIYWPVKDPILSQRDRGVTCQDQ